MKHIPQHPVLIQYVSKSVFSLHVRHTLAVLKKEVLIHSYKNMQIINKDQTSFCLWCHCNYRSSAIYLPFPAFPTGAK